MAYVSEKDDRDMVEAGLKDICSHVHCFPLSPWQSYLKSLAGLLTNRKPLQVNYYHSRKLAKWVNSHAHEYDVLYCQNMRAAQYISDIDQYKIWNIVDAFSMNYQSAKKYARGLWHWIYKVDSDRCCRYEQELLGKFDKKLIVSKKDRRFIVEKSGGTADITVIENYTVIPDNRQLVNDPDAHNVVFVGAMNYEPNVTAVTYFCKQILPQLQVRYPDLKFYIVGKTPTSAVKSLQSEHVIVTGWVDDIWDYLKIASVVVAPMLSGSGIQNKILQALSVGACVVTTSIGMEGLEPDEGQPFVADGDEAMIEKICYLFENAELRKQQGSKSVEYIRRHYSMEVIREKFRVFLES
ncbi:MAG: glycosyltransferase family 4 protein [Prevotella sp.]|nr:glycosyltransferase family 4 protein [Prevotella sp.]